MSEVLRNKFIATGLTIAALVGGATAETASAEKLDSAAVGQISLGLDRPLPNIGEPAAIGLGDAEAVDTQAAIENRKEKCTEAALQPPDRFYISRRGFSGIDVFDEGEKPGDVQTSVLPTAFAEYGPVKMNGKVCDPALVERVMSATIFVDRKVPKKIYFSLFTSNGNRKETNNIALLNSNENVISACKKAESQPGRKKGKVRMTMASVVLADSDGKIENTDSHIVDTASWTVKCKTPRSISYNQIKTNKDY